MKTILLETGTMTPEDVEQVHEMEKLKQKFQHSVVAGSCTILPSVNLKELETPWYRKFENKRKHKKK